MTLCIEGFNRFVTSTTAPIATGWSESCRVGFAHLKTVPLHGALQQPASKSAAAAGAPPCRPTASISDENSRAYKLL